MKRLLFLTLLLSATCLAQVSTAPATYSGNLTAAASACNASNCISVQVTGSLTAASIQLAGTWSATVQFEASTDGGVTWNSVNGIPTGGGSLAIQSLANGVWNFNIAGQTNIRARVSAFSSGTVAASITLSPGVTVPNQVDFSTGIVNLSASDAGTCATANACDSVTIRGYGVATVAVRGTYSGSTLVFEFSDDNGTTFFQNTCTRTDAPVQEGSEALPANQSRAWDCGIAGSTNFRVRQSAISTGTAQVQITLSTAPIEPAPTVFVALPANQFDIFSNPAVSNLASASQAAGGAGVRNVATGACFSAGSTAAVAANTALTVNLRDGASGAGTVKATWQLIITTTPGQNTAPFCATFSPPIIGTANTAMTLEFSALLTGLLESVSLQGFTTTF